MEFWLFLGFSLLFLGCVGFLRLAEKTLGRGTDSNMGLTADVLSETELSTLRKVAERATTEGKLVTIHGHQLLALLDELDDAQSAVQALEDELEHYYDAEDTQSVDFAYSAGKKATN